MQKRKFTYWDLLLVLSVLTSIGFSGLAQEKNKQENVTPAEIFQAIEKGIGENDIRLFSNYLAENSFISLRNSTSGYYSINQVHYVLKDYFSIHKPINFHFDNIVTKNEQPYATGVLVFTEKGKRDSAVIYVSLKKEPESWKISQLSIN